jgi:cytochrome b6-f complex subunit 5
LFGIFLGLVPVTLVGLFVTAYLQYMHWDQVDLWLSNFYYYIDLLKTRQEVKFKVQLVKLFYSAST